MPDIGQAGSNTSLTGSPHTASSEPLSKTKAIALARETNRRREFALNIARDHLQHSPKSITQTGPSPIRWLIDNAKEIEAYLNGTAEGAVSKPEHRHG